MEREKRHKLKDKVSLFVMFLSFHNPSRLKLGVFNHCELHCYWFLFPLLFKFAETSCCTYNTFYILVPVLNGSSLISWWHLLSTRWSDDVIRRTGMKNFNAVSHNRTRPYFRIQHGKGEVRARQVYLNVHSVTGNVVETEWFVEFWRWKCCREFGNNT